MIALLQRVSRAQVAVNGQELASIGNGLLILLGVERGDDARLAARLADRVSSYRVFSDREGRMNLDVQQIGGAALVVPQFTLTANTRKGRRPGFDNAAAPALGRQLFQYFVDRLAESGIPVCCGEFAAHMTVSLCNDGPATFWLQV